MAECVPNNTCSAEGNMFMEYIDTLVLSVKKKELTEAEAMRRYTEYKNGGTPSHPVMCDARVRASRVLWPNQRSALTRCPPTLDNRPRLVERSVVSRCFSDRARLYLFDRRAGGQNS